MINAESLKDIVGYNISDYKYKDIELGRYDTRLYESYDTIVETINRFFDNIIDKYIEMNDKFIADSVNFKKNKNGIGFNAQSLIKWVRENTSDEFKISITGSRPYIWVLGTQLHFDTDKVWFDKVLIEKVNYIYRSLIIRLRDIELNYFNNNDPRQKKVMILKENISLLYDLGLGYDENKEITDLGWSNRYTYNNDNLDILVDFINNYHEKLNEFKENQKEIFETLKERL